MPKWHAYIVYMAKRINMVGEPAPSKSGSETNAFIFKLWNMKDKRWAKHFATCNTTEYFSELIKIAQFYFSVMADYANVERFFP